MYEDGSEQFSLRWNNFFSNLTSGFHSLWEEEDFVDVTLAADGKFIQAHKIVLSVCSPYFKHLFKVNPCKHPIVILKDVGYKELSGLLQFMYKGEVNVYQEELADFLKTAELLQIKGLTSNDSQTSAPQKEEPREKFSPLPQQSEEKKKQMPCQSPSSFLPAKRKRPDVDQSIPNNTHRSESTTQTLPALPSLEPIDFVESEIPENSNERLARLFDVDSSKPVTNKPVFAGNPVLANPHLLQCAASQKLSSTVRSSISTIPGQEPRDVPGHRPPRCNYCPLRKNRFTSVQCNVCKRSICKEHTAETKHWCLNCAQEN